MKLAMADWEGFAQDVIDLVIRNNGEVTLGIDDIRVAARTRSRSIYQSWWWDAQGNRAHPQFGGFFHHFLKVIPHVQDGRVARVTFRPRRSGVGVSMLKAYWQTRHLLKNKRRREVAGWADFGDYLLSNELEGEGEIVELPVGSVKMATHTRDDMIYSPEWWSHHRLLQDRRTKSLLARRIIPEPVLKQGDGSSVEKVRFRRSISTQ